MDLFLLFISATIVNNFVLSYFLGICPFLGVSRRVDMAVGMGFAVTFVMTASALVTWVINNLIIGALLSAGIADLGFLKYITFIFVIAGMVQLVEMYLKKFFPALYDRFGIFLPLITTNCAILGACLFIDLRGYNLVQTIIFAVGGGLGFTLAISIMAGIREQLDFSDVPKALRGAAITLITAAILSMAFMGFAGMGG